MPIEGAMIGITFVLAISAGKGEQNFKQTKQNKKLLKIH
jgi:hypothetical protein